MTNDPTVTTLTRWAIVFPGESAELVIDQNSRHPWFYDTSENVEHALLRYQEMFPRETLRVVRVDVTITDPAAEEGQG